MTVDTVSTMNLAKKLERKREILRRLEEMVQSKQSGDLRAAFDSAITHLRMAARERELDVVRHVHFDRARKAESAKEALAMLEQDQSVLSAMAYLLRHFRVDLETLFGAVLAACHEDVDQLAQVVAARPAE